VLELAEDGEVPLLERAKFAGILGMLHDEFFMKRIAGLKRQVRQGVDKPPLDGPTPVEVLEDCRVAIRRPWQTATYSSRHVYAPQCAC
jgi:polyphosphate kinase